MVITVQIMPDGKSDRDVIGTSRQTERGAYIQWCVTERAGALGAQSVNNKRLTMTMLDTFDYNEDDMNVLATTIYCRVRSEYYAPDVIIYGTVYIGNENAEKVIDFAKGRPDIYLQAGILTPNSKIT